MKSSQDLWMKILRTGTSRSTRPAAASCKMAAAVNDFDRNAIRGARLHALALTVADVDIARGRARRNVPAIIVEHAGAEFGITGRRYAECLEQAQLALASHLDQNPIAKDPQDAA